MSRLRKFLAVSFRAKVLVPVIFVMICLLAVTAWGGGPANHQAI